MCLLGEVCAFKIFIDIAKSFYIAVALTCALLSTVMRVKEVISVHCVQCNVRKPRKMTCPARGTTVGFTGVVTFSRTLNTEVGVF